MRIILDECLPRRLKFSLPNHDVATVPEAGFAGLQNGKLLRAIEGQFDVFITIDANLAYQQNLTGAGIGIVVLRAASNRYEVLTLLMPKVEALLSSIVHGKIYTVE